MSEAEEKGRNLALIVYVLQAVGFFNGLTWIIGVIINYVKQDEVQGTWVASHFAWQIKTFWVGLIGSILGALLLVAFGLGMLIWAAVGIWCIFRVVKGFLFWNDRKELGTGYF